MLIEGYPDISVRRIATVYPEISPTSLWSFIYDTTGTDQFHKKTHAMYERDFAARVHFLLVAKYIIKFLIFNLF